MTKKIGIIDYEVGNLNSLITAFTSLNYEVFVTKNILILKKCDLLVLPGVGSFPIAMKNLNKFKLSRFIQSWHLQNKFILGICLGMQLLCQKSFEIKETKGLGIIPGEIIKIPNAKFHIGWNKIEISDKSSMFHEFDKNFFYFNHQFIYKGIKKHTLGKTTIDKGITSIISNKNTYGFQFHPEKSQHNGIKILDSFLRKSLKDA